VISGLTDGYKAGVKLLTGLRYYLARLYHYGSKGLQSDEPAKIAIEFCTEAAVLIAVFPILDTIIPIGGGETGLKNLTWGLILKSEGIALILLMAAVIISGRERD
jgi:hypothetical protein